MVGGRSLESLRSLRNVRRPISRVFTLESNRTGTGFNLKFCEW